MDTEAEKVEKIRADIYRKMSPAQKCQEVWRMRELAWQIKAAYVRATHLDWDEQAVQDEVRKIFLYAFT